MINHNFLYRDGTQYFIEIDPDKKDVRGAFMKAGNLSIYNVNEMKLDLISDRIVVETGRVMKDSEGNYIPLDTSARAFSFWDQEWFEQSFQYMAEGGILGFAGICLDIIFKNTLEETRVFKPDGTFVKPIYCNVVSTPPSNEPDFNNGSLTASVVQSNGYNNLQVRYRKDAGTWSAWTAITTSLTVNNLGLGIYDIEFRSSGTDLIIKPTFQVIF